MYVTTPQSLVVRLSLVNVQIVNQDLVSCMSHPTDRSLAVALQFNLNKYETENYPKTSRLRRLKRQTYEHKTQGNCLVFFKNIKFIFLGFGLHSWITTVVYSGSCVADGNLH